MQRLLYSEVMAEYRTPGMFNTNGIWQIGPMIIQWGTEEQKAQWLPSILEAEEHWCQGFSEPMAGNDLANLRTTAIYDADDRRVRRQRLEDLDLAPPTWPRGGCSCCGRTPPRSSGGRSTRGSRRSSST